MKVKMNPILKKELTLGSRTMKMPLALMFYNGLLAFVALLILYGACSYYNHGNGTMQYGILTAIFPTLAVIEMILICLIIPIITASSIAGERERQTLDILLTTPVTPTTIVLGKVWTALINVFMFIISSLPSMAIAFLFGGLKWSYLAIFVANILVVSFFVGAIGIWCSSTFKKTVTSVIVTLLIEVIFFVGTLVAIGSIKTIMNIASLSSGGTLESIGALPMLAMLNPLSGFADFLTFAMTGTGLLDTLFQKSGSIIPSFVTDLTPYWFVTNLVITTLIGILFVWRASIAINPLKGKKNIKQSKQKRLKNQKEQSNI